MPRRYDGKLLDAMKANEYETDFEGVKILVKPIPEGGEPGDLDPRLYRQMKNMPLLIKLMPKTRKKKAPLETIMPYRKMFGEYKGSYIADEGVTTEYCETESADGYRIPVRVYKRENAGSNLPMFVYFHGGGFFGGGPDIVEQMCKTLVQNLNCVACNVDYRLCPENHYPQPLDDCFFATKWAYENAHTFGADQAKLAVSGDSAGGNLAAAVTLRDIDENTGMVAAQVLIYPVTLISKKHTEYFHGVDQSKYASNKRSVKIIRAMTGMMGDMMGPEGNMLDEVYLQGNLSPEHPYASPALGEAKDLPPTLLIFGEHDFLVFDNFAYARKLTAAKIPLKTIVYRGMGHGFADQIGVAPQAEDCMKEISAYLKTILNV